MFRWLPRRRDDVRTWALDSSWGLAGCSTPSCDVAGEKTKQVQFKKKNTKSQVSKVSNEISLKFCFMLHRISRVLQDIHARFQLSPI